jgi:hypothetical protein
VCSTICGGILPADEGVFQHSELLRRLWTLALPVFNISELYPIFRMLISRGQMLRDRRPAAAPPPSLCFRIKGSLHAQRNRYSEPELGNRNSM